MKICYIGPGNQLAIAIKRLAGLVLFAKSGAALGCFTGNIGLSVYFGSIELKYIAQANVMLRVYQE